MSERKGVAGPTKKIASQFIRAAMMRVDELSDECRNSGKTADEAFKRIAMECAEAAARAAGGVPEALPPSSSEAAAVVNHTSGGAKDDASPAAATTKEEVASQHTTMRTDAATEKK
jgi:hypothetical protein